MLKGCGSLVAESGGKIVGFCHGDFFSTPWMCGKTCYLSGIITKESERGKGIGKKMLNYIEGIAKSAGCRAIILESGTPRTASTRATASRKAATASRKSSPSHQDFSKTTGRLRPRIAGLLPPHRRHGHGLPFFTPFPNFLPLCTRERLLRHSLTQNAKMNRRREISSR